MADMDRHCTVCNKPAVWIKETTVRGNFPFCEEHAKEKEDFDTAVWRKIKDD